MNRRSLLIGTGALTLNYLLTGCRSEGAAALRVRLLEGSVPVQILQEFQRRVEIGGTQFLASEQLSDLFALLQTWKTPEAPKKPGGFALPNAAKPAPIADLVTLGDYWLGPAIQQALIQPLPLDQISGWQQIPPTWQQLVRRDAQGQLNPTGQLWAAPYRWGSLVIAYNREKFKQLGWTPSDWEDLWRPELKGNLSLPDSARSVIGLTLKKLGQSVNNENLESVRNLAAELQALHQQVKFYSSDAYLQPLVLKDSWIAVGWSTEVLPVIERNPNLAAIVPESGTILTADLWVRPARLGGAPETQGAAPRPAEFQKWIEFCWQPAIAAQLSLLSLASSPIVVTGDRSKLPTALQQNSLLLPPASVIDRSEFLLPINNLAAYRRLWVTLRQRG